MPNPLVSKISNHTNVFESIDLDVLSLDQSYNNSIDSSMDNSSYLDFTREIDREFNKLNTKSRINIDSIDSIDSIELNSSVSVNLSIYLTSLSIYLSNISIYLSIYLKESERSMSSNLTGSTSITR
jgi:hypothetical protein